VLPQELRELALAALPTRAPYDFLIFPATPVRALGPPRAVAAAAYAARSAFAMLLVGIGVMTAIVALVLVLQLVR